MLAENLFLCKYCFRYFIDEISLSRHEEIKCNQREKQLGTLIYSHVHQQTRLLFYEINCSYDKERMFCQDLCLFSKLFIGDKGLSFDVNCFKFYVLYKIPVFSDKLEFSGREFIGYFSKEKRPLKSYNLSCVLVSPIYQGQGYGRFLISLSYQIALKENMIGGPELPLSTASKGAYESFWRYSILSTITNSTGKILSTKDISNMTGIEKGTVYEFLINNKIFYQDGVNEYFVQLDRKAKEWLEAEQNRVKDTICQKEGFCI